MFKLLSKSAFFKNYYSTAFLQFLNYLIPFLLIPHIVRVLGTSNYGLINFAQNFIMYFILIVNYGFDYTATRSVAVNMNDKQKLHIIFWQTVFSKLLLLIIATIIFITLAFSIDKLRNNLNLLFLTYIMSIGFFLIPNWLFQGLNKVPLLNKITLAIKSSFYIALFFLLKTKEQYYLVPLMFGLAHLITGLYSFFYSIKKFSIQFYFIAFKDIVLNLKSSFSVFISTLVVNLYTTTNVVLIGFLGSDKATGLFSANSKIITIFITCVFIPFSQIIYPFIAKEFNNSEKQGAESLSIIFYGMIGIGLISSLTIVLFSKLILGILMGSQFLDGNTSLIILGLLPLIISVGNCLAIQGLLNLKYDKWFLLITSLGACICIFLNLILIKPYQEIGVSISWVITELFITIASGFVLFYKKINFWQINPLIKFYKKYV